MTPPDIRSAAFVADPYPTYARLRSEAPVCFVPALGAYWVTRHADALRLLSDPHLGKEDLRDLGFAPGRFGAALARVFAPRLSALAGMPRSLLQRDPPAHTRLRSLVQAAFTPKVVERLRPRVEEIADGLLERVAAHAQADLVADFAFPLPATVIAELLGVPPGDRDLFRVWSGSLILRLDPVQPRRVRNAALGAAGDLVDYFLRLIAERRAQPREDLISELIAAEDQGQMLTEGELLSTCVLLLIAGHETTTNLIADGTLALLQHPEQLERLRAEPGLAASAVEELLRFVSPVQRVVRALGEDVEVAGRRVRRGERAMVLLAAANRDPDAFGDPDGLDLARHPNPHLAFGRGTHFCLGAPLARLEGQIAFAALLRRLPDLRMGDAAPVRSANTAIRSLVSLPIRT